MKVTGVARASGEVVRLHITNIMKKGSCYPANPSVIVSDLFKSPEGQHSWDWSICIMCKDRVLCSRIRLGLRKCEQIFAYRVIFGKSQLVPFPSPFVQLLLFGGHIEIVYNLVRSLFNRFPFLYAIVDENSPPFFCDASCEYSNIALNTLWCDSRDLRNG